MFLKEDFDFAGGLIFRGILCALLLCSGISSAQKREENTQTDATFAGFGEISGNLMYFQRHRTRYRIDEDRFGRNLQHATVQGSIDFSSSWAAGVIGVDLGLFATKDLDNGGSPDHEISFFPWANPWSADWSKTQARSGASLYRAHLKLRHTHETGQIWGKLGYFQPSGPGVLGVNWSLMPGTYLGAEGGGDWGNLSLAGAVVTRYKAPWYQETYGFRTNEEAGIGRLWSLGARYRIAPGSAQALPAGASASVEAAYGEAPGFLRNAHLKFKYHHEKTPGTALSLSYQFYASGSADDSSPANHRAFQHYLALARTVAPYVLRMEFTLTRAPSDAPYQGYFVYRLSSAYGGAQGAYEPWWDNRSDWNHNRERALFVSVARTLDDWLPTPGLTLTASAVRGWGGQVRGVREHLEETAWSLDLTYRIPAGTFKDARLSLHYTHYDNKTHAPSWTGFKNLFQDERDLKFFVILPWQAGGR
jgi:hypothetical protein